MSKFEEPVGYHICFTENMSGGESDILITSGENILDEGLNRPEDLNGPLQSLNNSFIDIAGNLMTLYNLPIFRSTLPRHLNQ